jgi:hypothetical protein
MRLFPSQRWRRSLLLAVVLTIAAGSVLIYLVADRDRINRTSFYQLKPDMARAEVEQILGGLPAETRVFPKPLVGLTDIVVEVRRGWDENRRERGWDESSSRFLNHLEKNSGPITAMHVWHGPTARIEIHFDAQEHLVNGTFQHRITWRHKLAEWLPWLR